MPPQLFLRVLGGLTLERDGAPIEAIATQRKSLALLAILAVAGARGLSRDTCVAHIWPESDAERARGALRQTLHAMRARVGDAEIVVGGSELRLNASVLTSDVANFSAAIARGDLTTAIGAYGGPFLDGYHLNGAPAFEQWVAEQRTRLTREYCAALEQLATEASSRGASADAVVFWRRLAAAEPLSGRVAVGLMRALAAAGDPAGALRHAAIHESLLREELACVPDAAVTALAARLRSQSDASWTKTTIAPATATVVPTEVPTVVPIDAPAPETPNARQREATTTVPPRRAPANAPWLARALVGGALAIVVALVGWWGFERDTRTVGDATPRVLIAPFVNLTGDPQLDHIGMMAADRLALGVAQVGSMDVVPSITVMMTMRDTTGGATLRLERLSDATHAGLLVSGTVLSRGDSLMLQAQVTDVRTGKAVATLDPVIGAARDPIAVVDMLRDQLLGALGNRDRDLAIIPPSARAPKYAAYQALAAGFERFAVQGDNLGSRPFFERAIAIDSTYTRAYQLLGRQYLNAGEYARADTVARRIEQLPLGLSASERLQLDYMTAELRGDLAAQLRAQQALVARDSSVLALELMAEAALWLLRPDLAIPALRQAGPAYFVIGGFAARLHVNLLTEGYHLAGDYERELRTLVETQGVFADADQFRGRSLRALAGLKRSAEALAVADTMLRGSRDSLARAAESVITGAEEFRAHGDAPTASRLFAMAATWLQQHPPAANRHRPILDGIAMLATGRPDSAIVTFTAVARATARIDAAGYLALAQLARGDRASAQATADSLGALARPWLFGANTFWRAAIVGALGERDAAVQLLRQAHREGQQMQRWHYVSALDSLRGYPGFDALIRATR